MLFGLICFLIFDASYRYDKKIKHKRAIPKFVFLCRYTHALWKVYVRPIIESFHSGIEQADTSLLHTAVGKAKQNNIISVPNPIISTVNNKIFAPQNIWLATCLK